MPCAIIQFYFSTDCYYETRAFIFPGGILTPATSEPAVHVVDPAKRRLAIFIVLACTLLVAIGQYLIKLGANQLTHAGLLATAIGILTIPQLFAGYCLYALFTVMFVYALRHGELSVLYPLISLSYVWVTITAVVAFRETMNPLKIIGLAVIIGGVAVLGFGGGANQGVSK
jgi:drug/metabolite transporter (DMT)-like permease